MYSFQSDGSALGSGLKRSFPSSSDTIKDAHLLDGSPNGDHPHKKMKLERYAFTPYGNFNRSHVNLPI